MNLYIISGLGADFKVLERIKFPEYLNVIFIDWLMPEKNESFENYVRRMSEKVDGSEPFCLLGYSFGGMLVQEINKLKPAKKVVILGSIKSDKEKSRFIKSGRIMSIPKYLPEKIYRENGGLFAFLGNWLGLKNSNISDYFRVRDPYYLKWSVEKVFEWKFEENPDVIQILGDRDLIFPIKYSKPNYVIKGGTHLFPATKHKEVSEILKKIF
ncbi:MAG: alpha/beta hydrolase [Flavobacteriaceae bacterium]|jgi:hypothetical protein|nr:alpha/beta hydrolase [Flavobacteriaceae bacterium]